jgi:hypothetical protein
MPIPEAGFEQCYNGRIAMDMEGLAIVKAGAVQATNDKQ